MNISVSHNDVKCYTTESSAKFVGSAAAWRRSTFIKWTGWTLAMALPWWQHHEHCLVLLLLFYYYLTDGCQWTTNTVKSTHPNIIIISYSIFTVAVSTVTQNWTRTVTGTYTLYIYVQLYTRGSWWHHSAPTNSEINMLQSKNTAE